MYFNEDEIDSPNPIRYIVTHEVNFGDDDNITLEIIAIAMNDSKKYLEGEGVQEVKFRTSFDDYVSLEAYGWRMEDESEATYRKIHRSMLNKDRDSEYFAMKFERERKGLPL